MFFKVGLRVSELCNLQWGHLYENMNGDVALKNIGKGNKENVIVLDNKLVSLIYKYRASLGLPIDFDFNDKTPLILNENGGKMKRHRVWEIIKGAAKRAKVNKPISPHTLRHTFATLAILNGADLLSVRDTLGHSDISTTNIYLDIVKQETRESTGAKVDIDI